MSGVQSIFDRRKVILDRLEPFGFRRMDNTYLYQKKLPESGFEMTVTMTADGEGKATVIVPAFNEPYTLHLVDGAAGSFVGTIRMEGETLLSEIAEKCFESDVFKSAQAKALIEYVRMRYGDEPEFLWEKFPSNAVWRRKDTFKWYGALLTVSKGKLGINSDETVETIDLRIAPEKMDALIDHMRYFPGWHMNKKSWYAMILDGSVPRKELRRRLDEGYLPAVK